MKLIKKINNNYALALDSKGEEIIVQGRGIGFNKMPCQITNLSAIERTYYNVNEQDIALINEIPEEIITICNKIFDYANEVVGDHINPNLTFILADHIQFSIERCEKNIDLKMPVYYDIEYLYPRESKVAEYALELIFKDLHVMLPESEKTGIAMNIINSEIYLNEEYKEDDELVEICTKVIEKSMNMKIRRDSFNYSRFVTHLHYLFKRTITETIVSSDNMKLYKSLSTDFPKVKMCVDIMEDFLKKKNLILNEEEKVYLILHVNRLCTREDCNRKGHNPTSCDR